ncbi:MAG TPA: hypothetical protein VIU12_05995 [Chryseolinea sp.]
MKKAFCKMFFNVALASALVGQPLQSHCQTVAYTDKNLKVTPSGELEITPSKSSSPDDFNWYAGKWKIQNKKLKTRLSNSNEWTTFEATDEVHSILNGTAFMNTYKSTVDGKPFEGLSLTLFNAKTKLWSIYWADSHSGVMDEAPVVGSFEGNIGTFYSKDVYNGKPILVKAQWDITNPDKAVWSQAFSVDNGKTWEWNWHMYEDRLAGDVGQARRKFLKADPSLAIPALTFDANGELKITASATSSPRDFDFLVGRWKMYHRRLNKRLENCQDWTEFESSDENFRILGDVGNTDTYYTTEMPGPDGTRGSGKPFEGVTVRLFDTKTKLWSLYWVASNVGTLDPPTVGSFENNVGHFFCKDTFKGRDVIVLFRWDVRDKDNPVWSQAFTTDKGKTWEWNWYNVSERVK